MKKIVIGLTGQTGAGKSTASNAMKKCGCGIIDAGKRRAVLFYIGSVPYPESHGMVQGILQCCSGGLSAGVSVFPCGKSFFSGI